MANLIQVSNLTYCYPNTPDSPVLRDISLSIKKGEMVAIVGANGSGKSTLIRHFNGLLVPCQGSVRVQGLDAAAEENLAEVRRRVGMVFQNPDTQLFASVVEEDVAFGLENMGLPPAEIRARVDRALEQVGMLEYREFPPHRLSGGQKQKVAIAGILAMQPECIVLDEPTSMLDPAGKAEILRAVAELNRDRLITVVYVTHDMNEILGCDRLIVLVAGRLAFAGPPLEFFTTPKLVDDTGLQAPCIIQLVNMLNERGLPIPAGLKTVPELVEALCR